MINKKGKKKKEAYRIWKLCCTRVCMKQPARRCFDRELQHCATSYTNEGALLCSRCHVTGKLQDKVGNHELTVQAVPYG